MSSKMLPRLSTKSAAPAKGRKILSKDAGCRFVHGPENGWNFRFHAALREAVPGPSPPAAHRGKKSRQDQAWRVAQSPLRPEQIAPQVFAPPNKLRGGSRCSGGNRFSLPPVCRRRPPRRFRFSLRRFWGSWPESRKPPGPPRPPSEPWNIPTGWTRW